jgi:hypothetical protein
LSGLDEKGSNWSPLIGDMRSFLLSVFIFSVLAWGQTVRYFSGVIVDPDHAVIPGVSVQLRTADGQLVRTATTDEAGQFHFSGLPNGDYILETSRAGFRPVRETVSLSRQKVVTLTLAVAATDEQLTVTADTPQVNIESSGNRDAVDTGGDALEKLPVFDQDYIATLSRFLDPGAAGTSGVALVVDGLEANRVGVSPSAIQQVKINNDPYAAEFFRPGRGRIEVVTKPTAPAYHGTFNFVTRDSSLNAANAFATTKPPEQRRIYEGFLTGPVGRSKNTLFQISVDRQELDTQSIVFAQSLNGTLHQNVASPVRDTEVSARISHVFSDQHSESVDYSLEQNGVVNRGAGGVVLATAGQRTFSQEHQWGFTDTYSISPRFLNQFQIRYEKNRDSIDSMTPDQKIVVTDTLTAGGAQVDRARTENALHLNEIVTWTGPRHTFKAGVNIPNLSWRTMVDRSNFGGTYYFANLQLYALGQPYAFTMQDGDAGVAYSQYETGAFLQDEVRVRPNLAITIGMRYDWQNGFHDDNNFAPRFSFAYAPGKAHTLVLRGGAGIFFDRSGPGPIADLARFDGHHLQSITVLNPAYPTPFAAGVAVAALPSNLVVLAPGITIPYSVQYSFSIERQVAKAATISLGYTGSEGFDLFRSIDKNAPLPPNYASRPDPLVGTDQQLNSNGRQTSNALEISLRGRFGKRITGMAQYAFSKTYNDTSGINFFPANSYDLSGEWARADFDQRHRLNLLETITAGRFANVGIGLRMYSGKPYTITTGIDTNHDGLTNERPIGTPRNSGQGPAFASVDLRWFHDFKLVKSKKENSPTVTTAVDAFNIFNRRNYPTVIGDLSSPFFGRPVSALDPRIMQFTARLKF